MSTVCLAFGTQMQNIGRGWLIYDMTSSPMALTWVMISYMVPAAIFSLVGGVIADRMNKKSLMVISQLLNTMAMFVLSYVTYIGEVTFSHFIVFGVFNGILGSVSMPARFAIVPELVGDYNVVNASALQTATYNLSRIAGPILAGGLIAAFAAGDTTSAQGVGLVFFLISMLLLISSIFPLFLDYQGTSTDVKKTPLEDFAEGFQFLKKEKVITGLIFIGLVPSIFGSTVNFLLPAFNQEVILGGPEELGFLSAGMGLGALIGSLLLAKLSDLGSKGQIMFLASYGWAITIAIFAFSGHLFAAIVAGALTALFHNFFGSLNMSLTQILTPQFVRGRVASLILMVNGLMPLGAIPIGIIAEVFNIQTALFFGSLMMLVSTFILGLFYPEIRKIDKGHG
mgnify:FL=1